MFQISGKDKCSLQSTVLVKTKNALILGLPVQKAVVITVMTDDFK